MTMTYKATVTASPSSGSTTSREIRVKRYNNREEVAIGIAPADPSERASSTAMLTPAEATELGIRLFEAAGVAEVTQAVQREYRTAVSEVTAAMTEDFRSALEAIVARGREDRED